MGFQRRYEHYHKLPIGKNIQIIKCYAYYLYTRGYDSSLFNTDITMFEANGGEITALQSLVVQKISHFEKNSFANRFLVAKYLSST